MKPASASFNTSHSPALAAPRTLTHLPNEALAAVGSYGGPAELVALMEAVPRVAEFRNQQSLLRSVLRQRGASENDLRCMQRSGPASLWPRVAAEGRAHHKIWRMADELSVPVAPGTKRWLGTLSISKRWIALPESLTQWSLYDLSSACKKVGTFPGTSVAFSNAENFLFARFREGSETKGYLYTFTDDIWQAHGASFGMWTVFGQILFSNEDFCYAYNSKIHLFFAADIPSLLTPSPTVIDGKGDRCMLFSKDGRWQLDMARDREFKQTLWLKSLLDQSLPAVDVMRELNLNRGGYAKAQISADSGWLGMTCYRFSSPSPT